MFAAFILLLELPIVTRCCPTRGQLGNVVSFFESIMLRAIAYLIIAIIEFSGSVPTGLLMIAPGIFLLIVSGLYTLALIKGQEMKRSVITGGKGI